MGKNQSLTTPYPIILASTSKYRGALMAQLGWAFTQSAPDVNEDDYKQDGLSPRDLAVKLAELKARSVFKRNPHALVIGSDQVCSLEKRILDKPGTKQNAIEQLSLMSGKSHKLITAVTVISPAGEETFVNETTLHMRSLTREEITRYVENDSPLDCAGSYKLESLGIKLFSKIEMEDQTAIIGLPLIKLTDTLLSLGYPL